jgi:hypothetical protein
MRTTSSREALSGCCEDKAALTLLPCIAIQRMIERVAPSESLYE